MRTIIKRTVTGRTPVESASRKTSLVLAAIALVMALLLVLRHRRRARVAAPPAFDLPA